MSSGESSVLNFSGSKESSSSKQQSESCLDVADVPDRIFEALHYARQLQRRGIDPEVAATAKKIEDLLSPTVAVLAAAAEQLAEVA
jgi:hypothetical protein